MIYRCYNTCPHFAPPSDYSPHPKGWNLPALFFVNNKKIMAMLSEGIEVSDAALTENDAQIYTGCGTVYHYWKIVEV